MIFSHTTALLFLGAISLLPVITSIVYFRASPVSDSVSLRMSVSAHGVVLSALCLGAVFIGGFGLHRPEFGQPFMLLLLAPIILIGYSFWQFNGKKIIHLLQFINLIWLFFAAFLGGMTVTGMWL